MRIGIDVGTVRIGVAATDPEGSMAFPVATVRRGETAAVEVAALIRERSAVTAYVGLPTGLSGHEGASAADARLFAGQLSELTDASIRLIDERFSTTTATRDMHAAGRNTRQQRAVIDQAAAVVILESALMVERQGNLGTVTIEVPRKGSHD